MVDKPWFPYDPCYCKKKCFMAIAAIICKPLFSDHNYSKNNRERCGCSLISRFLPPWTLRKQVQCNSYQVTIYVFLGWGKIGVRLRCTGTRGKGRRKNSNLQISFHRAMQLAMEPCRKQNPISFAASASFPQTMGHLNNAERNYN